MKATLLILSVLLLTGCGRQHGDYPGFESLVDSFVKEGKSRGVDVYVGNITIKTVESFPQVTTTTNVIGYCDGAGNITIKSTEMEGDRLEQLVYHELGHCALGQGHTDFVGLMYPYVLVTPDYKLNKTAYLDSLFNRLPPVGLKAAMTNNEYNADKAEW